MDVKQTELDLALEYLMLGGFDKKEIPMWIDGFARLRGYDLVKCSQKLDDFIKPYMDDQGRIDGKGLKMILQESHPGVCKLLPDDKFKLSDVARETGEIIRQVRGFISLVMKGK